MGGFIKGLGLFLVMGLQVANALPVTLTLVQSTDTGITFNGAFVANPGTLTWEISTDTDHPDLASATSVGLYSASVTLLAPGLGINTPTAVTNSGVVLRLNGNTQGFLYGYTGNLALLPRSGNVHGAFGPASAPFGNVNDLTSYIPPGGPLSTVDSYIRTTPEGGGVVAPLTLANGDFFDANLVPTTNMGPATGQYSAVIPEASSVILMGALLASLIFIRHKRRGS